MEDARKRIEEGNITDEMLMHLVILPLTYKGEEKKQKAIKDCVDLAKQISDKEQETFALAGILAFTDKIISDEMKQYIKEVLVGFPCRFESCYPQDKTLEKSRVFCLCVAFRVAYLRKIIVCPCVHFVCFIV